MDLDGPGFVVHGWWIGAAAGVVVLVVAAGNWRGDWYLPVLPRLRGIEPAFLAGGQVGIAVAFLIFSAGELVPQASGWHLALVIAGFSSFILGGLGTWAYGAYASPGADSESDVH